MLRVDLLDSSNSEVSLRFQIIDTGVGIAEADLVRLFEAFEQVGDQKKQSEGTGLGLAISQRIVTLMGSELQVKSLPGKGSEFFFTVVLPLAADWNQPQAFDSRDRVVIGYEGDRRQILIVDDRWENRSVVLNLLEPLGFKVIEAENGQQGLAKLKELQPDLVITDIAMPVMDGFELLKQIRSTDDFKQTLVIVSSASVAQQDQLMAIDCGGNDFLAKPVHTQDLLQLLSTYLDIDWKYDSTDNGLGASSSSASEMVLPSIDRLEVLWSLAQQAKLNEIRTQLDRLILEDIVYQRFANQLLSLTKQFKAEEIEELLEQYLASKRSER